MRHHVTIAIHPGVLGIELMSALELLSFANKALEDAGREEFYDIRIASLRGEPVRTWSGVQLAAIDRLEDYAGPIDTLVVLGGPDAHDAALDDELVDAVGRLGRRAGRVVSICTGAFILARAGLLDGKRVTTHWAFGELLAARHSALTVDTDPIYVNDGNVWTSAGITAGLDLLLALIEEDLGAAAARFVARILVVFMHRTGNQAQFSIQLATQASDRRPIREVQQFIADNPGADLSLPRLAGRAQMSPRHFARVFQAEVGMSPGRYVEAARLETARRRLEESDQTVEAIAALTGFGSSETLRRVFHHRLGVSPAEYRRTFATAIRNKGPQSLVV